MKIIEKLSDHIEEEIRDAECYAKWALEIKDSMPEKSRVLFTISTQEMEHMQMLHEMVVSLITEYKTKNGEPPAGMQMLYDILHKRHIDNAATVKALHTLYREGK